MAQVPKRRSVQWDELNPPARAVVMVAVFCIGALMGLTTWIAAGCLYRVGVTVWP